MGFLATKAALGIYSVAVSASEALLYLSFAIGSAIVPVIGGSEESTRGAKTIQTLRALLLATAVAIALAAVVGPILLPLVYGASYGQSVIPFLFLLPGALGFAALSVVGGALVGGGHPGRASSGFLVAMIVGVSLDLVLHPAPARHRCGRRGERGLHRRRRRCDRELPPHASRPVAHVRAGRRRRSLADRSRELGRAAPISSRPSVIATSALLGRSEDEPLPMPLSERSTLSYAVVICTLDRRADLLRCIDSWLRQDPPPLEIVVVHGGPSNDLEQHLQESDRGHWRRIHLQAHAAVARPPAERRHRAGARRRRLLRRRRRRVPGRLRRGRPRCLRGRPRGQGRRRPGDGREPRQSAGDQIAPRQHLPTDAPQRQRDLAGLGLAGVLYRAAGARASRRLLRSPRCRFVARRSQSSNSTRRSRSYYVGDDFDLAYRVSRDYQLFQTPGAQVMHYSSPPQGREGGERMRARMNVVNHRYLSRKLLGHGWKIRVAWAWSEFGTFLLALLWWLTGHGSGRLMGTIDGQWDVLRGRGAAPTTESDNVMERSEER